MNAPSIQRRVLAGSVLAVAATIGVTGFAIHRAAAAKLAANGRDALRSVVELGAERVARESVMESRRGTNELSFLDGDLAGDIEWTCRRSRESDPLAQTAGFPVVPIGAFDPDDARLGPGEQSDVQVFEVHDGAGVPFRVAAVVLQPADPPRAPGRFPPPRRGARPGPGPGPGGERPFLPVPRGSDRLRDELPFRPGEQFVIEAAVPIAEERRALDALARLLAIAGLAAVSIAGLSIHVVVRRGLAPLASLSKRIESIGPDDLGESIREGSVPTELEPIVDSFESTRARLSDAFDRERRFTADAAHELRTPIAGLRATLEVALRRERTKDEYKDAARQSLDIALSMQDTVETLLLLARREIDTSERTAVELEGAVRRAFAPHAEQLERQRVDVRYDMDHDCGAVATVVPALLERITSNLASNAASYAAMGSTIEVEAWSESDRTNLVVRNRCDVLPADTAKRAFEPFWRADDARADHGTHAGLGLTLVRTSVEAMGGEASLETSSDTFAVQIRLPR
ncbi:MAG: ATP-binding protein [Planctomycetota bacterium]